MKILRQLYYKFPPESRLFLRRIWFFPSDLLDRIAGKRHPMVPPHGMIYTGSGAYLEHGRRFLGYFTNMGSLQPDQKVLDIGCGIGRMAVPLTEYLSSKGEYQGFDIVKNGIEWCQKKISSRYPNFHFRQVDIRNDLYRSAGSNAAGFRFPYDKEYFDFAFLTSVFTHMLPEEVENYLSEIFRVLKPGGRCLCTFFILESGEKTNNPAFLFPFDYGHYHTMSEDSRSANVAYSMEYLKEQLEVRRSFSIQQIHKGYWKSGRQKEELEFQDILIIRKEEVS